MLYFIGCFRGLCPVFIPGSGLSRVRIQVVHNHLNHSHGDASGPVGFLRSGGSQPIHWYNLIFQSFLPYCEVLPTISGPGFLFTYIIVANLILLNVFLSIICEACDQVNGEVAQQENDFEVCQRRWLWPMASEVKIECFPGGGFHDGTSEDVDRHQQTHPECLEEDGGRPRARPGGSWEEEESGGHWQCECTLSQILSSSSLRINAYLHKCIVLGMFSAY